MFLQFKKLIEEECLDVSSFFDVFAGTGVVTAGLINNFNTFYINDFLYSNELIYKAFFEKKNYDLGKLVKISEKFKNLDSKKLTENYVSSNYGNKFFEYQDSLKIGYILDNLNERKVKFALSNVLVHKGKRNDLLEKWSKKYFIYPVKSNYISYHDNSIKNTVEVLITNYKVRGVEVYGKKERI